MDTDSVRAAFTPPTVRARFIAPTVSCPYCRSTDTEIFSLFGQQLLTEQYYCNNCHTPFEYIKDDVHVVSKG